MSPARLSLLCACCALWIAAPALAAIYRWVDDAGSVHYGDRPPPASASTPLDLPAESDPQLPDAGAHTALEPAEDDIAGSDTVTLPPVPIAAAPWPRDPPCDLAITALLATASDGFSPVEATALDASSREQLQSLLLALSGRWRGVITEVTCLGGTTDAVTKSTYYYILAQGDWDQRSGRWSFLSEGDASHGATDKVFAHYLQPGDFLFYYDFAGYDEPVERQANDLAVEGNEVELLAAGPDEVAFYVKRRVGNVASAELRRFRLVGDSLEISELFFTAGILSGYRYWQLAR